MSEVSSRLRCMAALTADGIVGRVQASYPNAALVMLIHDVDSGVGTMLFPMAVSVLGMAADDTGRLWFTAEDGGLYTFVLGDASGAGRAHGAEDGRRRRRRVGDAQTRKRTESQAAPSTIAGRVFHHPFYQLAERKARMGRQLRHE